ncbi:hypothetical protein L195_g044839 [Trifolium pratense]|uniref:Uncharacterized protein n=2 Tax=Trifolium TaxID=3898 RepID=A0A2K3MD80_TRIPR|nr:hypothetical protein L195_g044839 [Trifolium pratense]
MISILTQERLLGASLGVILTSVVVFEQRRYIFASISDSQSHSQASRRMPDTNLRRSTVA